MRCFHDIIEHCSLGQPAVRNEKLRKNNFFIGLNNCLTLVELIFCRRDDAIDERGPTTFLQAQQL